MPAPQARVLVVDDDPLTLITLEALLAQSGYAISACRTCEEALQTLDGGSIPDIGILDVFLDTGSGIDLVREIRARFSIPLILFTGLNSVELAVEAMKAGATDFIVKPYTPGHLLLVLERALATRRLEAEVCRYRAEAAGQPENRLVGLDPKLQNVRKLIRGFAASAAPVLITGETGTGKELAARQIHELSPRHDGPFVAVNCGAVPAELFEADFFGHDKGAFTGAHAAQIGRLEQAAGGTLLLDEIGTMPVAVQTKLLRVLQEREFERVGSRQMRPLECRLIAAANIDLQHAVERGHFRSDLLYRLRVLTLSMPPLRERIQDLPLLAAHLLGEQAVRAHRPPKALSSRAIRELMGHSWPGNVRELAGVLERAALLSPRDTIEAEHLEIVRGEAPLEKFDHALARVREDFERAYLLRLFAETDGSLKQAAARSGISKRHLIRLRQKYGMGERVSDSVRPDNPKSANGVTARTRKA